MDFGATCYVCNNKSRFIDFRLPINDNVLYASKSIILIKGFKTILIIITTLKKPKQYIIYLYNIVLILLFYINVASL